MQSTLPMQNDVANTVALSIFSQIHLLRKLYRLSPLMFCDLSGHDGLLFHFLRVQFLFQQSYLFVAS